MKQQILDKAIQQLEESLGEGFLSCDIWVTGSGQSIVSHNGGNAKATALFDKIIMDIKRALEISEFSALKDYVCFSLKEGAHVLVINVEDFSCGLIADGNKTPLWMLLNIGLPTAKSAISNLKKGLVNSVN